jgi:hypothetical protein
MHKDLLHVCRQHRADAKDQWHTFLEMSDDESNSFRCRAINVYGLFFEDVNDRQADGFCMIYHIRVG